MFGLYMTHLGPLHCPHAALSHVCSKKVGKNKLSHTLNIEMIECHHEYFHVVPKLAFCGKIYHTLSKDNVSQCSKEFDYVF